MSQRIGVHILISCGANMNRKVIEQFEREDNHEIRFDSWCPKNRRKPKYLTYF